MARFNIFDNPYDLVLADWILSETSAESQVEVCNMTIADNQRKIIKNVLSMIEGKIDITEKEKTLIQKMFENSGYDDVAYKICEDVFKNKFKEEDIKSLFLTYDTSTKYMEILDKGENNVNSMIDVVNYCSVLDAYNDTNEQFRTVLQNMYDWCMAKKENPFLASAIKHYLETDNSDDVRAKIMRKVAGEGIKAGADIFGEQLVNRTYKFLVKNMNLEDVAVNVATNVTAVLKGMKIGYDIGVAFDNAIFNSDSTAQAYVLAHASVEAAEVLREVLEARAFMLQENPTAENAVIFGETFSIYRNAQMDIANKIIGYLSENNQAFMTRIIDDMSYEVDINRWLVRKADWQKRKCHDEDDAVTGNKKRILVACPVDVKMYDQDNNLILSIVDDEIDYIGENVAATVRNGIKYIVIFDEEYSIEIEAAEDGRMTYSVSSCDALGNVLESVHYKNIDIAQGQVFTGNLYAESSVDEERYALTSNGKKVDSEAFYVPKTEEISILEIVLDNQKISMNLGDEIELKYQVLPKDASLELVTWYSEDEKVVMVDEYGKITAVGYGTTDIVCQTLDGRIESKCEVVVETEIGHEYEAIVTEPTCEESGYTTHKCKVCGDSYIDSEVESLGHSFTNYISDNNATTESAGTLTATCDRCDATDTIPDPAGPIIPDEPDIPVEPEVGEVLRLSGATRYETGYKVADVLKERLGVEKFDAVVIATGKNFADALSGSYLAVVKNAPIILTNGKADNIATLHAYIQENVTDGGTIYILGGEAAVPEEVEEIDGFAVKRLAGSSRYDTNLAILEEAGITGDELIIATGKSFADSLSASAARLPILLVKPGASLSDDAKAIAETANKIYIIGGEGAVSKEIEEELAAYGEVERVFGNSRYETSVAVANTFFGDVKEVVIASGKNFPDGLCGGPLAATIDAPLILTADGKTSTAAEYVQSEGADAGYVLGGTGAIADALYRRNFLNKQNVQRKFAKGNTVEKIAEWLEEDIFSVCRKIRKFEIKLKGEMQNEEKKFYANHGYDTCNMYDVWKFEYCVCRRSENE